ncbi:MAG: glycosyltransferase family 39 protein, partial [Candidatus Zixiibacteriota bacterium]
MTAKALDKRLILILLLQLAAALVFVFYRTVDADEGFYLAAAQRVADGLMPYLDFFFPQAPLMPLTFFALSNWGVESLLLLRILASLAGIATTFVMYKLVKRTMQNTNAALVAAFLMAFGGLFLTWHSTFKPYAFVDLALLISFYFLLKSGEQDKLDTKAILFAWLALGIAINFRSIFLALIPIYVYALVLAARRARTDVFKPAKFAALGILLPSIPAIYFLFSAPEQFLFNNLGFHLQREPIESISALLLHKLTVVGKFLALPQTILLVGAAMASYFLMRSRYVPKSIIFKPAGLFVLVISAVYLVPTPVHMQYFQQATPYLIIMSLPCAAYLLQHEQLKRVLRSAAALYLIGTA